MLEHVKPWARASKFFMQKHYPRWISAIGGRRAESRDPMVFIVGCGRSGTTLLGRLIGMHPRVRFLHEPYHLWHALDPHNDAIGLFGKRDSIMLRGDSGIGRADRRRFETLFTNRRRGGRVLLEKTPYNAMRLAYLDALAPNALVLHVVRDGYDVVDSIDRIASTNSYRIAGLPNWNQWWGNDDQRWVLLRRDAAQCGYYRSSAYELETHRERASYEWLVSLGEVDRNRGRLGTRLVDVNFQRMVTSPVEVLCELSRFIGIPDDERWLSAAAAKIKPCASSGVKTLRLPVDMARDFNAYQQRFGFARRAENKV
jgi:hypothetical protein